MGMKSTATKNKWNAENYDRIALSVKKGAKLTLQQAAKEKVFVMIMKLLDVKSVRLVLNKVKLYV